MASAFGDDLFLVRDGGVVSPLNIFDMDLV
jgi:hypothetical protein